MDDCAIRLVGHPLDIDAGGIEAGGCSVSAAFLRRVAVEHGFVDSAEAMTDAPGGLCSDQTLASCQPRLSYRAQASRTWILEGLVMSPTRSAHVLSDVPP